MKTHYKYIHFEEITDSVWVCRNTRRKDVLGYTEFYRGWKEHVFVPDRTQINVFSASCLTDIAGFLSQLNEEKP